MSAVATAERLDDIRTFLPGISEAEYERRAKLRSLRNTAVALATKTESGTARQLAWTASDYAHALMYAPADDAALAETARFCTRIMVCAMQAEQMADEGIVA
jgi:hypothetical protein